MSASSRDLYTHGITPLSRLTAPRILERVQGEISVGELGTSAFLKPQSIFYHLDGKVMVCWKKKKHLVSLLLILLFV